MCMFEFHCSLHQAKIRHILLASEMKVRQLSLKLLILNMFRTLHKMWMNTGVLFLRGMRPERKSDNSLYLTPGLIMSGF
jgi:hypothetical protein